MESNNQAVLSVGTDAHLLELREQVLRGAGFEVFTTRDEVEAVSLMQQGACASMVLCHTLREEARQRLVESYRRHCPGSRIIGVSNVPWPHAPELDAIVYGVEGPAALIAAIRGETAPRLGDAA